MAGLMVNDLERKNDTIYRTRGLQERKTRDEKNDEKRTLMSHVLVTNRVDVCTLGHDILRSTVGCNVSASLSLPVA